MRNGALVFDGEFNKRSQKDQIAYLKSLAASQNQALDLMQKERNEWRDKAHKLEEGVKNAEAALYTQKDIARNLIEQRNQEEQQTAVRIHELESRVKAQDKAIRILNGDLG